jgi:hypothetical protein
MDSQPMVRDTSSRRGRYVDGMQWLDRSRDLIAMAIAAIAVILSLVTVLMQKRQQQRDAYRQIQDVLMSAELQRGRWMVLEISLGKQPIPERLSPEFYLLNRTLGMYDTLAMYVRRGVLPRRWVLDMWHHPLAGMRTGAQLLARHHREGDLGWTPWPELWSLLDDAVDYKGPLACCGPLPDFAREPVERKSTTPEP